MPIRILDDATINKIAAGEVVQRPLSVVKELVENALDAGADALTIEISGGGIDLIRVSDNGSGIEASQVPIAFCSHATSKIRKVEDLSASLSLGFRGEALPSIASVARVEIITKTKDQLTGLRYIIEGGKQVLEEEVACPDGTTIRVENLFFNVPARRKFLKKPTVEASVISDYVQRLIFCRPDVKIRYFNGKTEPSYISSGSGSLSGCIGQIWGRETAAEMIPVSDTLAVKGISVSGMISRPQLVRSNRSFQSFFINGRWIHSAVLEKTLDEAYKDYLVPGTYPLAVLSFSVDPDLLDVNVHPAKMEVKFEDENAISEHLFTVISECLKENNLIHEIAPAVSLPKEPEEAALIFASSAAAVKKEESKPAESCRQVSLFSEFDFPKETEIPITDDKVIQASLVEENLAEYVPEKTDTDKAPEKKEGRFIKSPRLIGQVFETYWFAEGTDPQTGKRILYMMDQHAAHERVLYDSFRRMLHDGHIASQLLAVPEIYTVNPKEIAVLDDCQPILKRLGFEAERFGEDALIVRAVPYIFNASPAPEDMGSLLTLLHEGSFDPSSGLWLDQMAMMACKAAVKGQNTLSFEEAKTLLEDLWQTDNPYNCPHGRPTMIQITENEIEKRFKRIM